MHRLKISLFGSFSVTLDEQVLRAFETNKTRALLAYLAMEHGRPQQRELVASLLWPDKSEARARQSLSQALYTLRRLLQDGRMGPHVGDGGRKPVGPYLLVQPGTLQLNLQRDTWVDVAAFIQLVSDGINHPHASLDTCEACLANLEAAAALYRGDFLADLSLKDSQAFEEWALLQRERLRRKALETLDLLSSCRSSRGELDLALEHAWRQVEMNPLWEHAHRRLIDLLARSGRRSAALEQYEACRQVFEAELGLPPEDATTALYKRIRGEKTPARAHQRPEHNLPAPLTPFIGRKTELDGLLALLDDPGYRLITVAGPGGCGKTRLALEAARTQVERFRDGSWLVTLATLRSPEAIPAAVAEALELPLQEKLEPKEQLKDYLRGKRLLLVLDSFEHLRAGAGLVVELLNEAPGLQVLVTSRRRLKTKGERPFWLSGLAYPSGPTDFDEARRYEAVQFFVLAGQRARPGFGLSEGNLESVIRICNLTEGMPLALLLAAAWLDTFSSSEVAAEIERRLDFLSADWVDLPARQRSLRATFEYSWGLLGATEQQAMTRMSVFRGGCTRSAAQAVAEASPQVLRALVENSMLERTPSGRYEIHELLRQFAEEKLRENPKDRISVRDAHARHYLRKLPGWAEELKGRGQADALRQADREIGNLLVAWSWGAERQQIDLLDAGLEGLCLFQGLRGRVQGGLRACQLVLENLPRSPAPEVLRLKAEIWRGHFLRQSGQHEQAARLLREELPALKPGNDTPEAPAVRAQLHLELGHALLPDDRQAARQHFQESLACFAQVGDAWRQAQALAGLGMVAHHAGTFAEAVELYQQSLACLEPLGDPKAVAGVLIELGHNLLRQGHLQQGEESVRRGCEIYRQIGDQASYGEGLFQLARVYFWYGKYSEALPLVDAALPIYEELGWSEKVAFNVTGKAIVLGLTGDYEGALRQAQAGLRVAREKNSPRFIAVARWVQGMARLAMHEIRPAKAHLRESIEYYRAIEQNDELGWALATLAYVELALHRQAEFRAVLREALEQGLEAQGLFSILLALPAAALFLVAQSEAAAGDEKERGILQAIELYALVRRHPAAGNAMWFEDVAGRTISSAAAGLPPERVQAAHERGQIGDPFAAAREVLAAFGRG